jgi:hypothetical protein
VPTALVKALRPESKSGFRVVLVQEWVHERFWGRTNCEVGGGLLVRASSAEALLGIIAASMLTFVGVVFTITLVARDEFHLWLVIGLRQRELRWQ